MGSEGVGFRTPRLSPLVLGDGWEGKEVRWEVVLEKVV